MVKAPLTGRTPWYPPTSVVTPRTAGSGAAIFLAIYLFLVYSRLPEVIAPYVGAIRIAMIMMIFGSLMSLFSGRLFMALKSAPSVMLILFTIWLFVCVPFSVWKGGSFQVVAFRWPIVLVTFLMSISLITKFADCETVAKSIAWGVLAIDFFYFTLGVDFVGRVGLTIGTLGNPNILAMQLLLGMPFLMYPVMRYGELSRRGATSITILLISLYIVGRSGSRAAVIALALAAVMMFFNGTVMVKAKLLVMFVVIFFGALVVLPSNVIARYVTIVDSTRVADVELESAIDSAAARRHHLEQSITLTVKHPIFGVGPGQFKVAAADLSHISNENAAWLETHNTYTQISSETGFPGIIFYVAMILFAFKSLWSLRKEVRKRPELAALSDLCWCLLVSLAVTMTTTFFDSAGYEIYLPMLCGIAVSLNRVGRALLAEHPQTPPAPVPPVTMGPFRPALARVR